MSDGQRAILSPIHDPGAKKKTILGPRTVECHKTSHGLPDPSPPRVGAHADKECEEGHDAESDGELSQVPRAGPLYAKQAVLLLAAVTDALGKVAALERRIDVLPITRPVWDFDYLALATFQEAIFDDVSGVQELSPRVYEPVIDEIFVKQRSKESRRKRTEIPVGASDSKDILMISVIRGTGRRRKYSRETS